MPRRWLNGCVYLTLEQAIEIHANTVPVSGGGATGYLDLGPLDSVLQHIQNDEYYPSLEETLTRLFFSVCKFHCFQDGNKRIAITLWAQMLLFNGYLYCTGSFIREMENISYHVAAGHIDKVLLREVISVHLAEEADDESLKLKIYHAITRATSS